MRAAPAAAFTATPVISKQIIGYSVKHRPIVAYHLGDPSIRRTSVILGQMHGDEHAGVTLVRSILHGRSSVEGLNLWVIPTMNPDGDAAHTRQNAHHVDLNRNWPDHWARLTGYYYSGPKPLSEPETVAMYRFLKSLHPHYVVVLHQPLYGVDTTDGGHLDPAFRHALSANLRLPEKAFRCWSFCHGSLTGWYTTRHLGIGETIEFGPHPSAAYLVGRARRGIIAALHGWFGDLARHNPSHVLNVTGHANSARVSGWAFDRDQRRTAITYTVRRDGHWFAHWTTKAPSPKVNAKYHLTSTHGYSFSVPLTPGRHTICLTYWNVGAGTASPQVCKSATATA